MTQKTKDILTTIGFEIAMFFGKLIVLFPVGYVVVMIIGCECGRGADPSGGVGVVGLKRKGFRFPTKSPYQSHICESFTALMGVSTNAAEASSSSVQNCEQ